MCWWQMLEYMQSAANGGNTHAHFFWCDVYQHGRWTIKPQPQTVRMHCQVAAMHGLHRAQLELGYLYYVDKNTEKAHEWYTKAAASDDARIRTVAADYLTSLSKAPACVPTPIQLAPAHRTLTNKDVPIIEKKRAASKVRNQAMLAEIKIKHALSSTATATRPKRQAPVGVESRDTQRTNGPMHPTSSSTSGETVWLHALIAKHISNPDFGAILMHGL